MVELSQGLWPLWVRCGDRGPADDQAQALERCVQCPLPGAARTETPFWWPRRHREASRHSAAGWGRREWGLLWKVTSLPTQRSVADCCQGDGQLEWRLKDSSQSPSGRYRSGPGLGQREAGGGPWSALGDLEGDVGPRATLVSLAMKWKAAAPRGTPGRTPGGVGPGSRKACAAGRAGPSGVASAGGRPVGLSSPPWDGRTWGLRSPACRLQASRRLSELPPFPACKCGEGSSDQRGSAAWPSVCHVPGWH